MLRGYRYLKPAYNEETYISCPYVKFLLFSYVRSAFVRQPTHATVMPQPIFDNRMTHKAKEGIPEMQPDK